MCCNQSEYMSGRTTDIDDTVASGLATNGGGECLGLPYHTGSQCLSTGSQDVFGMYWFTMSASKRSLSPHPPKCKSSQRADVYHVALPGEQPKPYDVEVADLFVNAEAIDWSTHMFKTDKLDFVRDIIVQYGDGLSEAQKTALSTM
jgi:hypothetical protein